MRTGTLAFLSIWLLLPLSACTAPNGAYEMGPSDGSGPGQGDGGGGPDRDSGVPRVDLRGGGGPDGASLTCAEIKALVTAELANSVSCKSDSECTLAHTACGLPGQCGEVYANTAWQTPQIDRQIADWTAMMCGDKICPCPDIVLPAPACNDGKCGPKKVHGPGVVGDACALDSDCQSGQCLTQAQDKNYPGGYCTVKGCNKAGAACPSGSACRGFSNTMAICLLDCDVMAGMTCRTAYNCCSGPGPSRGMGWCAPPSSSLCLAR